ncbi:hypothetical protein LGQ02_14065 [Bacillus shivajii]|uniref:hypothetical protein n=1 Tax=Bacillus shivajii TaxID=1983719 RepID=UPI001CFC0949|nr:hypothetical protein [Bacillus shivajii]UCZ51971.1 hypothetical protein LGQ02_14065 [Bacillus shivajii]
MSERPKALEKMAKRVIEGYEAVHEKKYDKARETLEPIKPFLHQEEQPNVKFLSYLAIAQIGSKAIDDFLKTYEELQTFKGKNDQEEKLKARVDEMFVELMEAMNEKS